MQDFMQGVHGVNKELALLWVLLFNYNGLIDHYMCMTLTSYPQSLK